MIRRTVGLLATLALLNPGAAQAHQSAKDPTQTGSAQTIQMHSQQLGEKEVSGIVVKSSGDELKLRTDSGIISLKVDKKTLFQDPTVKHARDVKEGQQVRTSFTIEKDTNLARSIKLDDGLGGSGLSPDPGLNDTGGSALDRGIDASPDGLGDVTGTGHMGDLGQSGGRTY